MKFRILPLEYDAPLEHTLYMFLIINAETHVIPDHSGMKAEIRNERVAFSWFYSLHVPSIPDYVNNSY